METSHQGHIAFIIGCIFSLFCAELPPFSSIIVLIVFSCYCFYRQWRKTAGFIFGFCCFFVHAYGAVSWSLPHSWYKQPVQLSGTVVDIAVSRNDSMKFKLKLSKFDRKPLPFWQEVVVSIRWQQPRFVPQVGDRLVLEAKLKPPHGLVNEGGFSYQKHLLINRIRATGYVTTSRLPVVLEQGSNTRQNLYNQLVKTTDGLSYQGILLALALGEKQHITNGQWQSIQGAGISHLLAISGLHIGIVFAIACWLFNPLISLVAVATHKELNSPKLALIAGILCAGFYAYLAGFAIATVRAMTMLVIFTLCLWRGKNINSKSVVSCALFAILLVNPLAVLEAGLWLSVTAVATILAVFWWWPECRKHVKWRFLMPLVKIQLALFVLMLPLSLLLFNGVALAGIVVNLFAVPWVSSTTVPLALLAAFLALWDINAQWLWVVADKTLWLLFLLIDGITSKLSWLDLPSVSLPVLLLSLVFVLSWFVGMTGKLRGLSFCLILPLLFSPFRHQPSFKVNVLDVGQGLSVVVESEGRALVYDLGPKYQTGFNAVDAAVLPFLKAKGYRQVDTLIISHSDNDHAGHWQKFLAEMPVNQAILPAKLEHPASRCLAGSYQWQSLNIEVLWPIKDKTVFTNTNDSSCVVRLSNQYHGVLLSGDISKHVEAKLLRYYQRQGLLQSTIIIAPHHGSNSSSSESFIQAVAPQYVVYTSGFLNRYGFPRQQVVTRYQEQGVIGYNSAADGQVSFELSSPQVVITRGRKELLPHWYYNQ